MIKMYEYHISIIIPVFNEFESIDFLVESLNTFFKIRNCFNVEVIFVDDGSTDDSIIKLQEIDHKNYSPKIIKLSQNYGSHAAVRAGVLHSSGKYTMFLSADLQDPLVLIDSLYHEIEKGFDIVWGERKTTTYSFFEALFSGIYNRLMKKFVHPSFPKNGFDVVIFNEKVKSELNENIEKNSSILIQILMLGFKQSSIGYDKVKRERGKSKWTIGKKIKLFIDSFVAFSYAPIRLVTITGFLFFIIGLLYGVYILLYQFFIGGLILGWPTLIFVIMIGFGTTNISLGIIAEYLWRTLDASRKRKVFIIDEIIELEKTK